MSKCNVCGTNTPTFSLVLVCLVRLLIPLGGFAIGYIIAPILGYILAIGLLFDYIRGFVNAWNAHLTSCISCGMPKF